MWKVQVCSPNPLHTWQWREQVEQGASSMSSSPGSLFSVPTYMKGYLLFSLFYMCSYTLLWLQLSPVF